MLVQSSAFRLEPGSRCDTHAQLQSNLQRIRRKEELDCPHAGTRLSLHCGAGQKESRDVRFRPDSKLPPRAKICFGYETALRIARSVDIEAITARAGGRNLPPAQPPKREELKLAIALLQEAYPTFQTGKTAHFLIGSTSRCRRSDEYEPHVCMTTLSGKPFYQLAENVFFSSPTFAFVQMAPLEDDLIALLELGYELCGSYRTRKTSALPAYQVNPLMSVRDLNTFVSQNPALRGSRKARRVLRYLADGSASPRETKQALLYGLPAMYGGYGLGIPSMNFEVKASNAAYAISGRRSFRCDLCWPKAKIDVEYQSRETHEGEENRIRDSRRANALSSMGWTVVSVTNDELDSLDATDTITQTIRRLLGLRSQIRISDYHARKLKLRRKLGLPTRYA